MANSYVGDLDWKVSAVIIRGVHGSIVSLATTPWQRPCSVVSLCPLLSGLFFGLSCRSRDPAELHQRRLQCRHLAGKDITRITSRSFMTGAFGWRYK